MRTTLSGLGVTPGSDSAGEAAAARARAACSRFFGRMGYVAGGVAAAAGGWDTPRDGDLHPAAHIGASNTTGWLVEYIPNIFICVHAQS